MSFKNSQIAMETILIYGFVILVVTLAVGALAYFGVLDLGKFLPDSCTIAGEGILCENYVVKKGGAPPVDNIQFELRNKVGKNIQDLKVTVVGEGDMQNMWTPVGAATSCSTAPALVTNGAVSAPLKMSCTLGVPVGSKIKGRLDIEYKVVGSLITRTETGSVYATVAS